MKDRMMTKEERIEAVKAAMELERWIDQTPDCVGNRLPEQIWETTWPILGEGLEAAWGDRAEEMQDEHGIAKALKLGLRRLT